MILPSLRGALLKPASGGTPIDVGPGAVNGSFSSAAGYTYIPQTNPANATGTLTSYELWAVTAISGCKVGVGTGSGSTWEAKNAATIGAVTAGSKQTFTGLSIAVASGEFAAIYYSGGTHERDTTAASNYYKSGDQFGAGSSGSWSNLAGSEPMIYGTGST